MARARHHTPRTSPRSRRSMLTRMKGRGPPRSCHAGSVAMLFERGPHFRNRGVCHLPETCPPHQYSSGPYRAGFAFDPAGRERSECFPGKCRKQAEDFRLSVASDQRTDRYVDPQAGKTLLRDYTENWVENWVKGQASNPKTGTLSGKGGPPGSCPGCWHRRSLRQADGPISCEFRYPMPCCRSDAHNETPELILLRRPATTEGCRTCGG